jgi:hypothetical protein
MPIAETPKLRKPRTDPYLKGAAERVKRAAEEAERRGVTDASGKRVRTDLPHDMREGTDRDSAADVAQDVHRCRSSRRRQIDRLSRGWLRSRFL